MMTKELGDGFGITLHQPPVGCAYFSGLQNGAVTFACLAKELGKAHSTLQDLQTSWKRLGGMVHVQHLLLFPISPAHTHEQP